VTSPDLAARALPATLTLWWLVAYTAVLAAADLLLTVSVPGAAVVLAMLVIVLRLALPAPGAPDAAVIPVLVAVPVVRLVTVAAPGAEVPSPIRMALLAVPILVTALLAARERPPEWRLIRPGPGGWRVQGLIALAGLPLAVPVYLLAGGSMVHPGGLPRLVAVALLVIAVIPDELLFRGLLVPALAAVAPRAAVPLAAAVYAATFLGYASVPVVLAASATGVALGWLRWRTGSAAGVIVARIVLIATVYLVVSTLAS
jgi:hypothetical protein